MQGGSAGLRAPQRDGEKAACRGRQSADGGKKRGVEIELCKGRVFTSSSVYKCVFCCVSAE